MKKLLYTILSIFFFAGCTQKDGQNEKAGTNINSLFNKAGNLNYSEKQRIQFLDDINEALGARKFDTILKEDYYKLAYLYNYNKSKEKQLKVYKKLEQRAINANDIYSNIQTKCSIGSYFLGEFSNDSAFYYYSKAEKLSKRTKGNPVLASILQGKADLLWCQKDYAGAEATATKALKIAVKKKGYEDLMFSSYLTIANSLVGMNKNEKALEYYYKALEKADYIEVGQKLTCKSSTYNYIANIYQKLNQHQKTIKYINSNIDFKALRKADLKTYSYLMNTRAYSKFKLNDPSALGEFDEVLHMADSTKFAPTQVAVKLNLSEYYLAQKDSAKALSLTLAAQRLAHQNNIFEDELKAFQLLANIVPGKYSFYNERYIKLNDSLQNIERATRDKFARIEFETEEITTEKKVIEEQKNILLQRIWIISCIGLLSLMVVVLWFKNKSQKAKNGQLLLEQEHQKDKEEIYHLILKQQQKIQEGKQLEKRRISQELHDGIMGKLSSIRMNLFVLNKKSDPETIAKCLEYVKEIQNIEKEIRIISHDLSKNLFSDNVNFVSIVENLFTAIKSHNEIDFTLKVDERIDWETLDNNTKINIYRIIQEALQNIDKYAQAENVSVKMEKKETTITIEINDDGIGFDTKSHKNGIGITNMQARMQKINGTFKIESKPKKGTKINLTIPN